MIIGLGVDLCQIERIERTVERFGDRFLHRIYTEDERARANRRPQKRDDRLAQMFAAKEACSKALGTGFRQGVFWRDMEVRPLPSGKPTLQLHGGALARMEKLTPDGYAPLVDVSLTDEAGVAQATVVISAVREDELPAFETVRQL